MTAMPLRMLLDPPAVEPVLRNAVPIDWPSGEPPCDARVERCWPIRADGFSFEWSFKLAGGRRYTLHGIQPAPTVAASADSTCPTLTPTALRGVCVQVPALNLLVHSADCDPHMPHLARCLDPGQMSPRLTAWLGAPSDQSGSDHSRPGVACEPLSYRAGRRAAIAYCHAQRRGEPRRVFGKTYRNGRGARLMRLHEQLNERLQPQLGWRICVPRPLGFLPDLHMALFEWVRGSFRRAGATAGRFLAAVDALSALHRTALDGLTPFTVADDCAVLRRWHAALTLADPRSAEHTHGLLNALLQRAAQLPPARPCTIHRDFYARQVLISARATTLVDFDTLAQGDPGVDLGNLVAHALFDQLAAGARLESLPAIGSGWMERYEHLNQRIDQRSLAFYTASALFRVGAVHALRSATRRHAPALWQLAAMKISHHTRSPLATALGRTEQHDALSH